MKNGDNPTKLSPCQNCATVFEAHQVFFEGKAIIVQRYCPTCYDQISRKRDAARHAELEAKWREKCPADFLATDPKDPRLNIKAVGQVLDWEFGPKGLLLYGPTARGKTRGMWLLLQRLFFEGKNFKAMSAATFCEKSSDAAGRGESDEFTESLVGTQILFIDDIGKGKMTERNAGALFNVLDQRFINQKPVFMTMNLIGDELAKRIDPDMGAPLVRRMREFCHQVKF